MPRDAHADRQGAPAPPGPESAGAGGGRAWMRTAVVWEVLKEALDVRAKAGAASGGGDAAGDGAGTGGGADPGAGDGAGLAVLDTGGGAGHFAVPVARLGHRVTVVDPSPNALFALERRAAEAGVADRVRGVQGDAHGLLEVVEAGGYDAVLCHGVLEYVDDPAESVRNVVAALRPSGMLSLLAAGLGGAVLSRALAGHFTEARTALTAPDGRWGAGDPVPRRFTADELTGLVESAGLRVGSVHGVRIFSDLVPGGLAEQEPDALESLLALESAAARVPAFHAVASRLHVLAEQG